MSAEPAAFRGTRTAPGPVGTVVVVGVPVEIVALLASPVHAFEGRPSDGLRADPDGGAREHLEVRAGLGVVGDRYFAHPAHRRAAVTVFAAESLDHVARELHLAAHPDPLSTRRNVVLRGFPVDDLAARRDTTGAVFSLDSGDGPIRFRAHRPASPCRWLDVVLAPGAWRTLRGRGGVRCEPLDDGRLTLGPATLRLLPEGRAGSADVEPRSTSASLQ